MTIIQEIKLCIEQSLEKGNQNFIICPFGDIGMQVKHVLNEGYGIKEAYILDNHMCKYNSNIKPFSFLESLDCEKYTIILSCLERNTFLEIKKYIVNYILEENIIFLASIEDIIQDNTKKSLEKKIYTKVGKYSYGPLCYHWLVESVGAFCSIAEGANVVENHAIDYITTHPMLYVGGGKDTIHPKKYNEYEKERWYFKGVTPQGEIPKTKRITIGNDVWLGLNTIITNGANIGNGVIAGAGSVITKDIPDYAIVVGAPARIIRYRYMPEQIEKLNKIAWWDWTDNEIRERYKDFYLPIEEFLEKYTV